MKIFIKIILVIFIIVLLLLLLIPSSPLRSLYSKNTLLNNPIITELGFKQDDCSYNEATMFGDSPSVASVSCITVNKYKLASDVQKSAVDEFKNIFKKNNWISSDKYIQKNWDITYQKDGRKVRIYPYDWGLGCLGDECKLIMRLD